MWATTNKSTAPSSSSMGDRGCKSLASADRSYFPFHSLGMLLAQQNPSLQSSAHLLLVLPFKCSIAAALPCSTLACLVRISQALAKKIDQNVWCHGFCAWVPLVVTFMLHQGVQLRGLILPENLRKHPRSKEKLQRLLKTSGGWEFSQTDRVLLSVLII